MFSILKTAALKGLEPCLIQVEADVSDGLPVFEMVGYLSSEVKEARERVRIALRNSGIFLPPKRITVNLAPANIRKEGTSFDLAIGLSILEAIGRISPLVLQNTIIVGELGLNGKINPIRGILALVAGAREKGIKRCIIPKENEKEGNLIPEMEIIGVKSLVQILQFLDRNQGLPDPMGFWNRQNERETSYIIDNIKRRPEETYEQDFSDIQGQEECKRATLISAAGMHNLLYIGPPGAGKTMMASRIPTILPDLTREESLELTKIYSVVGMVEKEQPLIIKRPFRSPHHTCTPQTLAGGGRVPKPGEISLANHGVLFLDELPEFSRKTLEILRQPLEEHRIRLNRTTGTYSYPARFMLVGAMNPCSCGYYPDRNKCRCSNQQIQQYLGKISLPLLDRLDLCVEASKVEYEDLVGGKKARSSREWKKQVIRAVEMQKKRYLGTRFRFNSDLTPAGVKEFCTLSREGQKRLEKAYEKLDLSVRGYHRILKTARTIADLEEEREILPAHISEAVFYRTIDKKYWMG